MELNKKYEKVAIVDLDIANPYFRSRERQQFMEEQGIKVYHNSFGFDITQDLPALSAAIKEPLENKEFQVVVDAGGDDSGARVLNQFRKYFLDEDATLFFVVNGNRPETRTVEGALEHLRRIEDETGLEVGGLINNTHLLSETTVKDVLKGHELCLQLSEKTGIPVVADFCYELFLDKDEQGQLRTMDVTPIQLYLRPSWLQNT